MSKTKPPAPVTRLNRIAEILEERQLSQDALAGLAGLTQRSVSLYTTGAREPSLETLYKIAKALKIDVCDLLA